jgi:hypothetical protein
MRYKIPYVVYAYDNHADHYNYNAKGGATAKANRLNAHARLTAITAARSEEANVEHFEKLIADGNGDEATRKYLAQSREALNRYRKLASGMSQRYGIAPRETFDTQIVYLREVTNLMTGTKVMERSDTPYYCSVSSETYWSR